MKNDSVKEFTPIIRDEFLQEISSLRKEIKNLDEKINERTVKLDRKTNENAVELVNAKFHIGNLEKTTAAQSLFNEEFKKIVNSIDNISKKIESYDRKTLELESKIHEIAVITKKIEYSIVNGKKNSNDT